LDPFPWPSLLLALEVLVARFPAGASGRSLSVGVRTPDGDRWWHAELGAPSKTALSIERPAESDCFVLLGEREADSIVSRGTIEAPIELFEVHGDARFFADFIRRLASTSSWLEVQSRGGRCP
jgi:hypothetical protein